MCATKQKAFTQKAYAKLLEKIKLELPSEIFQHNHIIEFYFYSYKAQTENVSVEIIIDGKNKSKPESLKDMENTQNNNNNIKPINRTRIYRCGIDKRKT